LRRRSRRSPPRKGKCRTRGLTTGKPSAETKLSTQLPAEKASAEAALNQAQVDLAKTVVHAGVAGRVEQFILRPGDIVNPLMRPAGLLIPKDAEGRLFAGFGQIEAQIMKRGMIAEVTCLSKPLTIIPMVVTSVQDFVAAGQVRSSEQLVDVQQVIRPGTLTVTLEPLYKGGLDGVTAGSSCIANAIQTITTCWRSPTSESGGGCGCTPSIPSVSCTQ